MGKKKINIRFLKIWLAFIHIKPMIGHKLIDLVDVGELSLDKFTGAWANVLIKAKDIREVIDIVPLGLKEKKFDVIFIDKVENVFSLIENEEVNNNTMAEATWLLASSYVFKIIDPIFPYK